MNIPNWYELILLGLAAWRTFHVFAFDDILDRPRRYVTRLSPKWQREGDATGENYREGVANFIQCPYCFGAWIAAIWWVLWLVFPSETLWVAAGIVISVGVIAAQRLLSSE